MKKKILFFIALISILACFFVISISAETPSDYIEFGARFEGSDDYITVYTEDAEKKGNPRINFDTYKFYSDVDFTKEVDISTVTGLDFSVTKVYGSNTCVTRITKPTNPFVNCTEVKWFTQEKAMDNSIPGTLFYGWSSLKSFDFGNATYIGNNSFEGCGFETLVIPAQITQINSRTFASNLSLTSLKFEGSTKLTGNANAFAGCTALKSVDLGNVSYIGKGTFSGCTALTSIVIPAGITAIYESTFLNCTSLNSVIFEDGSLITSIGNSAFQNVPASNLTVPSGVTSIGQNAYRTSGIQTIVIPAGCTSIGSYAFHTSKATSLSFADGFTGPLALSTGVFQSAASLASAVLPEGITTIGNECFTGCAFTTFVLPNSVTTIGGTAFAGCKKLTTFTIRPESTLQSIGSQAFKNTSITSFYFPNSLTSIGSHAFAYNENSSLVELVNFENCGLTSIPNGLFRQCGGLKTIKFPYGITSLNGSELFTYCNVDTIILPQTLTTISKKIEATSIGKVIFAAPEGTPLPANAPNVTIEYANYCETYFDSHAESEERIYTYYDKNGNVTKQMYTSILKVTCPCGRNCGEASTIAEIQPLFVSQGYSATQYGSVGVLFGVAVNNEAIAQYKALTGNDITFGLFAGTELNLGTNDAVNQNGEKQNNAISVDYTNRMFNIIEIKITGFSTDEQKEIKIAMGAYVIEKDDEGVTVSYIQGAKADEGQKYNFVTFNSIMGPF